MINLAFILTHNCLALTKRCIESVRTQDIPVRITIFDNGSTDGTREWLAEQYEARSVFSILSDNNAGVSHGWNQLLGVCCFNGIDSAPHALVIGNDTILPPFFYRELLSYPQTFVTGFAVESMDDLRKTTERHTEPHPDFSAFLIRRECWERVGPFDESMKLYASDCDYHVRAHRAGIEVVKVPVPFYHERSSTLHNAPPQERVQIQEQANRDRARFRELYGCIPGEPAYSELFR